MAIDVVTVGAIAFGSGGIAAGVLSLLRFPSDKNKVIVDSAQGAVVVQKTVIDSLTAEIKRLNEECNAKDEEIWAKERVIRSLENIISIIDDRKTEDRRTDLLPLLQPPTKEDD